MVRPSIDLAKFGLNVIEQVAKEDLWEMWTKHPACPAIASGEVEETIMPEAYLAIYQQLRRDPVKKLLATKAEVQVHRVQRRQMLAYALASCPYGSAPA